MSDERVISWWNEQGSPQYNYQTSNPKEECGHLQRKRTRVSKRTKTEHFVQITTFNQNHTCDP